MGRRAQFRYAGCLLIGAARILSRPCSLLEATKKLKAAQSPSPSRIHQRSNVSPVRPASHHCRTAKFRPDNLKSLNLARQHIAKRDEVSPDLQKSNVHLQIRRLSHHQQITELSPPSSVKSAFIRNQYCTTEIGAGTHEIVPPNKRTAAGEERCLPLNPRSAEL